MGPDRLPGPLPTSFSAPEDLGATRELLVGEAVPALDEGALALLRPRRLTTERGLEGRLSRGRPNDDAWHVAVVAERERGCCEPLLELGAQPPSSPRRGGVRRRGDDVRPQAVELGDRRFTVVRVALLEERVAVDRDAHQAGDEL